MGGRSMSDDIFIAWGYGLIFAAIVLVIIAIIIKTED